MALYFLVEITDATSSSNILICNASINQWVNDISQIILIYTDFEAWRKREKNLNNVKPIIFAHVELLELIYPTSVSCSGLNEELYTKFDLYNTMLNSTKNFTLISANFFRNMGTILSHIV